MESSPLAKVFVAYTTVDDRGSIGGPLGFFSTQGGAKGAAERKGYWGGDGAVRSRTIVKVGDRFYLIQEGYENGFPIENLDVNLEAKRQETKDAAKRAAIAHLTQSQRLALGLDF